MKHQRFGLRFARQHDYQAIFAWDPGTGKTSPAIRIAQKIGAPILIICRRDDFLTWRLELEAEGEHYDEMYFIDHGDARLPRPWNEDHVCHCGDDLASHARIYDHSFTAMQGTKWFIVSYDLVKNPRIGKWIKTTPFRILILDELHYVKRWQSQRTKRVYRTTRHIPRRLGLTGTLISNDPGDVFSQCLVIDDGRTFGQNWWKFRKRHYIQSGFGWYIKRSSKTVDIPLSLKNIAMAVEAEDVLPDLPPLREVIKSASMSRIQQKYYEQVVKEWEIELRSGELIEIDQIIVQLQKLKQIASGFFYKPDHSPIYLRCPKTQLMIDALKGEGDFAQKPKIVIWGSYTAELQHICQLLTQSNITYAPYFGPMTTRQREQTRLTFATDPGVRCFVGQVDRGVGMNELIVADTAIWHSNSFKVVSKQQSSRRTRRKGSERHQQITHVNMVTEGSADLAIARNINKAMDVAASILAQLKQGIPLRQIVCGGRTA